MDSCYFVAEASLLGLRFREKKKNAVKVPDGWVAGDGGKEDTKP